MKIVTPWLMLTLCLYWPSCGYGEQTFHILYSAESHAALTARVGPKPVLDRCAPVYRGGLARLVTAIRDYRRRSSQPCFVFSGGGEVAGGPYDRFESTKAMHRLRSDLVIRAFERAQYDGLCLGDEEFGQGRAALSSWHEVLPILSANVELVEPSPILSWLTIERKGIRLAVCGLTTEELQVNEFGLALPEMQAVHDPIAQLKKLYGTMADKADAVIVLAHLGEEKARELLERIDEPLLVFVAHRKTSPDLGYRWRRGFIVNFDYLVTALHLVTVTVSNEGLLTGVRVKRLPLDGHVLPDKATAAEAGLAKRLASRTVVVDRYAMAECPHCQPADDLLQAMQQQFGNAITIRRFTLPTPGIVPTTGIERATLWRAERLSVRHSPELFVSNVPYRGPIAGPAGRQALRAVIEAARDDTASAGGNTYSCRPTLTTTLVIDEAMWRRREREGEHLVDWLFPGARLDVVEANTAPAKRLRGRKSFHALPQLYVSAAIEGWPGFQETLADYLEPAAAGYRLTTASFPPSCFPDYDGGTVIVTAHGRPLVTEEIDEMTREDRWKQSFRLLHCDDDEGQSWLAAKGLDGLPFPLPWIIAPTGEVLLPRRGAEVRFLLDRLGAKE